MIFTQLVAKHCQREISNVHTFDSSWQESCMSLDWNKSVETSLYGVTFAKLKRM